MSGTIQHTHLRRMSFVGLIAWVSICLLVAGLFPHLGTELGKLWVCFGLFGLIAAVGLSEAIKTEVGTQSQVLDAYITESRTDASLYAAKNAGRNRSFYHDGTESHAFDAPA